MKKVSVIVPVYNGEKYIKRCIDSLLKQSYKNYEIIIVDDGSNDNTSLICNRLCESNIKIKYIYIDNAGVSRARNKGIQESKGEYILFVDSDDTVEFNYIERLSEAVDGHVMAMCGWYDVNRDYELDNSERDVDNALWFITAPSYGHYLAVWNKIFRKEYLTKFRVDIAYLEDGVFIYEYLQNANGKVAFISDKLYHYMYNADSVTREFSLSEKKITAFHARQIMIDLSDNSELKKLCQAKYHETVTYILFNSYKYGDKEEVRNYAYLLNKYCDFFYKSGVISIKVKVRYCGYQIIIKFNLGVRFAKIWDDFRIKRIRNFLKSK